MLRIPNLASLWHLGLTIQCLQELLRQLQHTVLRLAIKLTIFSPVSVPHVFSPF